MRSMQATLCAGMLALQAVVLFLTVPVMLALTDVATGAALAIGLGLTVACILAAGMVRRPGGLWFGAAIQVASIALGVVVTAMFAAGAVFAALYFGAWYLGGRIDRERAERTAEG